MCKNRLSKIYIINITNTPSVIETAQLHLELKNITTTSSVIETAQLYLELGTSAITSWQACCWVQMSVYSKADSRRKGGKVQGQAGSQGLQSDIWD